MFLSLYLRDNYAAISEIYSKISPINLSVSVIFLIAYKFSVALLWHYLTMLNGTQISLPRAITSYFYSMLGKYIPGKIFLLGARLTCYAEAGAEIKKVAVCFFLENILTLLGATLLFLLSLFFFSNDLLNQYWYVTFSLIVLFFIAIHPTVINFILHLFEKVFHTKGLIIPVSYGSMLKLVLFFVLNWTILGIGFYLLVCSFYPIAIDKMLYCSGIFALAVVIGILSLFAPSGIGVRESILILGLSLIVPKDYAATISIASRLWFTSAELLLAGGAFIADRIIGSKNINA